MYALAKHARQRPSVIFRLHEFCERTTRLPGRDEWTAWQFDQAVTTFGRWVENKLNELHPKTHKPIHTLEQLLAEPAERKRGSAMMDFFGSDVPVVTVHPDGTVERVAGGKK